MAKEYIEREAAVDALNKALFFYEDETEARFKNEPELDISEWFLHRIFVQNMNDIDRQTVLDIPAADVAPVVRGNWEWDDDGMDWGLGSWRCSQCHTRPETTWQTMKDIVPLRWCGSKFCPNCGADMRSDEKEEYGVEIRV